MHISPSTNSRKIAKLILATLLVGFLAAMLGLCLKHLTEHYENILFAKTTVSAVYVLLFPVIGLSAIWFLRKYIFRKKQNKGIKEVLESLSSPKGLPLYKVPSHFVNGFLTVISGGSTGIEVSTVVAAASIGSVAQSKEKLFAAYRSEFINAGIAAGITVLFNSPLAGFLFCCEVITHRRSRMFFPMSVLAIAISYSLVLLLDEPPLFAMEIGTWHYHAIPYFLVLGTLAGFAGVYLTRCVLFFKKLAVPFSGKYRSLIAAALTISLLILILPQLYGDGYHAIRASLASANTAIPTATLLLTLSALVIVKPVITAITLASGGDGGVFAPGIFIGAFLGLLTALLANSWFGAQVVPLNFMFVGMGAVLSASINAPFTALFVVCGISGNYSLFIPILGSCLVSKLTAQHIFPYTVYTYKDNTVSN